MACNQGGTYAEIRNKLHCSASGRIAQNPLTSPLSCRRGGRGALPFALFYLPTYLPNYLRVLPCTLSSFYQRVSPYPRFTSSPPLFADCRLPIRGCKPATAFSISRRVAPSPPASPLSFLFHPLFFSLADLSSFLRSSYLIGHFVLHRPRYYRGNSRAKRRPRDSHNGAFRRGRRFTPSATRSFTGVFSLTFSSHHGERIACSFLRSPTRTYALPVISSIPSTKSSIFRWSFVSVKY